MKSAHQALEAVGERLESLPEGLTDAQRVNACKRMLRLDKNHEAADALKHWELLQKVDGLLRAEIAKPEGERPIISTLKQQKPDIYKRIIEESCCDHSIDVYAMGKKKPASFTVTGGHNHQHGPRVDAVFQAFTHDTSAVIPADYVEAAKETHRIYIQNRRAARTHMQPEETPVDAPPSFSYGGGGGGDSGGGGHTCGSGCDHGAAAPTPTPSQGGGLHYHGDTPCTHSHPHPPGTTPHVPAEPHLPIPHSNVEVWAVAALGAAGVGAYLINELGKASIEKPPASPQKASWQERAGRDMPSQVLGV